MDFSLRRPASTSEDGNDRNDDEDHGRVLARFACSSPADTGLDSLNDLDLGGWYAEESALLTSDVDDTKQNINSLKYRYQNSVKCKSSLPFHYSFLLPETKTLFLCPDGGNLTEQVVLRL